MTLRYFTNPGPGFKSRHKSKKTEGASPSFFYAGGESGIRTRGTIACTHAFQACALDHSAISP